MDGEPLVLVLVSFALVLLATVLLVIGLLMDGGLPLIFVSIGCSVAAGLVLIVAVQRGRARPQEAVGGPAPLPTMPTERPAAPVPVVDEAAVTARAPATVGAPAPVGVPVESDDDDFDADELDDDDFDEDDDFFPIADYDDLKVSEIMPLLPELYPEELDIVEERERSGKARVTIVERIAELRKQVAGADVPVGAGAVATSDDWGVTDDEWAPDGDDEELPIADYAELRVADILPLLDDLDDDELEAVRQRESETDARKTILDAIDRLLEPAPAEKAPARKAPAKRGAAKKKAPAKRGAAKKKAPARKTAAKKKAPGKRGAAKKKAPARKTAAKKRTTRGR